VRDKKLTEEDIKDELLSNFGISEETTHKLLNPMYSYQKKGFQGWELSNNGATIRNTQQRIDELQKRLDAEGNENKTYEVKDVKVEEDIAADRVKLFFPAKPDYDTRTYIKKHGFRFSRYNMCWQAFMSAASRVKDMLEGMEIKYEN